MDILRRAKKTRLPGEEWKLVRLTPSHEEILREVSLVETADSCASEVADTYPKRKRGRPRKK